MVRVRPVCPGPDYLWIDGYWYAEGGRYRWHAGYWTRRPYKGALWVGPRYEGGQFFSGYWEGSRGRVGHDHRLDSNRGRDYDRHEFGYSSSVTQPLLALFTRRIYFASVPRVAL